MRDAWRVETVRALTGLPINYFVTVNFTGFNDLVNKLGGVWLDVDHRYLCDPNTCPGVSKISLLPGYQRLNARMRSPMCVSATSTPTCIATPGSSSS